MGKQCQLLLKPTEVELGLKIGVEFDKTKTSRHSVDVVLTNRGGYHISANSNTAKLHICPVPCHVQVVLTFKDILIYDVLFIARLNSSRLV